MAVFCAGKMAALETYYTLAHLYVGADGVRNQSSRLLGFTNGARLEVLEAGHGPSCRGRKFDMVVVPVDVLKGPVWEREIRPTLFDTQGVCLIG